ncbi:hypothetical protein GOP47_0020200 [Adiantum capillus-veneris]|uniref:Uncharacterized protein n=1 Tax=Adiantum capillus-veneris TaxID=13818 RepID=A0A9D4UCZ4_ADICA|nr:hypothetical protein GOP47_0020200 [Adiantum capillus-veneris]
MDAKKASRVQVPWYSSLVFGSIAGAVSSTATFPLDLVRRRRQFGAPSAADAEAAARLGVCGTLKEICKREGWKGLYRGIGPEYLKIVPTTAIMFLTFDFVKRQLQ